MGDGAANLGGVHRLGDVLPLRRARRPDWTKALTGLIFGAILAWIALLLVTQIPPGGALGVPLWAGICVLVTVFIIVYAAKAPALSDIPANVFGYAAVAGLALTGKKLGAVTSASLEDPFVVGVISLIIGAVLGYISQKIAVALMGSKAPCLTVVVAGDHDRIA